MPTKPLEGSNSEKAGGHTRTEPEVERFLVHAVGVAAGVGLEQLVPRRLRMCGG